MTDKLLAQIKDFVAENKNADLSLYDFDDKGCTLGYESDNGIDVEVRLDFDKIDSFDDLRHTLFHASQWYSIDDHVAKAFGIELNYETAVNSYSDQYFEDMFDGRFSREEVAEFIDDAYDARHTLDTIAREAGERGKELEKEEKHNKKNKGIER